MMEQLKQLLSDMKRREELRTNEMAELNAESGRIDLRQESETERFVTGIEEDINAGIYNHITTGGMNKLIDEQKVKIEEKYNAQREELNKKLEEVKKKHTEERANDYKQIGTAIKDYHLDMVLEANKAQKELGKIETERDRKLQEIDSLIKQKEAEQTHLIIKNREYMDVQTNETLGEIKALGLEIEKLKEEKDSIISEYSIQIERQNEVIKQCIEQKERAGLFLSKIRLSEKSIDEISDILFKEELEVEGEQPVQTVQPEQPAQPTQPSQPVQPEQPAQPVQPEQPSQPVQPEQPAQPTQPSQPVQPEKPTQPAQPAQPVQPEKPSQPVQPEKPTQPVQPAQPVPPTQPSGNKTISRISVYVSATEGTKLDITRGKGRDAEFDWATEKYPNTEGWNEFERETGEMKLSEQLKRRLEEIRKLDGKVDTKILKEIIFAVKDGRMSEFEAIVQIRNYSAILKREPNAKGLQEQFSIEYDLKGIKKQYDKKTIKSIEDRAKYAKDMGIATVKNIPISTRVKWAFQDVKAFGKKIFNRNKALPSEFKVTDEMLKKQSPEDMEKRKNELKDRLKKTGHVTTLKEDTGLNAGLQIQDAVGNRVKKEDGQDR